MVFLVLKSYCSVVSGIVETIRLTIVGTSNLTTSNSTKIAATSAVDSSTIENSGSERKINPAASTSPTPRGRTGVLSSIDIITNKTDRGNNAINTPSEINVKYNAINSNTNESPAKIKTIKNFFVEICSR